jgi:hypothetical protein
VSRQQRIDRSSGLADAGLVCHRPIEGLAQGLVIELQGQGASSTAALDPDGGSWPTAGDAPDKATRSGTSSDVEILAVTGPPSRVQEEG